MNNLILFLFRKTPMPKHPVHFNSLQKLSILLLSIAFFAQGAGCDGLSSGDTQFTNENDLLAYGKKIYQTQCVKCHALDGKSVQGNCIDLSASKMDETDIGNLIYHGRKDMPAFSEQLGEPEILAVSRYCRSLQKK